MARDIRTRDDIEGLLRAFYGRVFQDDLLRHIFVEVAHLDQRLESHLPRIADFWDSVLFHTQSHEGGAFGVHKVLNGLVTLEQKHFDRWVATWTDTVNTLYDGVTADLAIRQAQRFANAFERRLRADDAHAPGFVEIRERR